MPQIITVTNQKGGVGKTALAVHIAAYASMAAKEKRPARGYGRPTQRHFHHVRGSRMAADKSVLEL
ncbi:parA family protein, partial [Acidithiobacillus sp. GGI-221]